MNSEQIRSIIANKAIVKNIILPTNPTSQKEKKHEEAHKG